MQCRLSALVLWSTATWSDNAFTSVAYLPLGHLGHGPPLQKNATKMRHFQAKNLKNFLGKGHSPLPKPHPYLGGEYSSPHPHLSICGALPQPHAICFRISIIRPTLHYNAVIDEFGKSNRRLVLLVDLGLLNGTRLEVGPVNIQPSHWVNLLMQFVMDWRTLTNSIINTQHSFRIMYDMYTSKHTFSMTILWNITCKWAGKSLKFLVPDVRF